MNPVARALQLLTALAGHTADGRRLRDIAQDVASPAPTTLRDLQQLESLGYTQRIPGREDCWRLTPKIVCIATAHQTEVARLRARLEEIERNYSRSV